MEGWELIEYYPKYFPPSEARNDCVGRMKEGFSGYEVDTSIWFDTDHVLPYDVIVKLLSHDLPIVSGVYYLKRPPFFPIVYRKKKQCGDTGFWLASPYVNYPDELFEADYIGMGCVRIDREVFLDLKVPYFEYRGHSLEEEGEEDYSYLQRHGIRNNTEEFVFWDQVRERWKIMVDPSIQLLHFGKRKVGKEEYEYNKQMGVFG